MGGPRHSWSQLAKPLGPQCPVNLAREPTPYTPFQSSQESSLDQRLGLGALSQA